MTGRTSAARTHLLVLLPVLVFVHVSLQQEDMGAPMEKMEIEALYSAIQGFVGSSWNGSELYPDPCGWTPIQGVSCDSFNGSWYVTAMNIGPVLDNSLTCIDEAKFSYHLFELRHLKTLSFFNCFSSTHHPITIPSDNWEKLSASLESLEFRSNKALIGEIPTIIGQLSNLRSLVLVDNALSGALPTELCKLVHLKRLALGGNKFSGPIPSSLGYNLSELLIMDFSGNDFSGQIPGSLGQMSSLLKLDLSNNHLRGDLQGSLGQLRNLTLLDLRNNNLTGGIPRSMQEMVSVHHILLSNNPLGGNIMEFQWDKLSNLTTLDLATADLTGTIPNSVTNLKNLRFLALDNNKISGSVPKDIATLPNLSALHLDGNNFTGQLEFSEEFYVRMGRRFTTWNNKNLCYKAGTVHAPFGVEQCKQGTELSLHGRDETELPEPNSSDSGWWWSGIIMQEMVVVVLLVMLF